MRVFVYEWSCCAESAPASLRREGLAMLRALLDDFQRPPGIGTVTMVHHAFAGQMPGEVKRIPSRSEEQELFCALAAGADATLVIAPETAGALAKRTRWVLDAGGTLLGSSIEAIELTADKRRCEEWWRQRSVPTPQAWAIEGQIKVTVHPPSPPVLWGRGVGGEGVEQPVARPLTPGPSPLSTGERVEWLQINLPVVLKPIDGAGSQSTFLVRVSTDMPRYVREAQAESALSDFMVQDYVAGLAASIAFLIGPKSIVPLPPAAQILSDDGRFRYLGGTVPLPSPLARRALALGRRAIESLPGLRGFVGVDLVLGKAGDGSADYAIEINPRVTTSYTGLRKLACDNLALAMLQVALGQECGELRWRDEVVHY